MLVYSRLYDEVSDHLKQNKQTFEYKRSTFMKEVGTHPTIVKVSDYLDLPNEDFMEAVFEAAMKRLPDEKTRAFWAERENRPTEVFQEEVLRSLAGSAVVAINQIRFVDNPYFEQKRGLKYKLMSKLYGLTDKAFLREFGKKMPAPIQKLIRKVFL